MAKSPVCAVPVREARREISSFNPTWLAGEAECAFLLGRIEAGCGLTRWFENRHCGRTPDSTLRVSSETVVPNPRPNFKREQKLTLRLPLSMSHMYVR